LLVSGSQIITSSPYLGIPTVPNLLAFEGLNVTAPNPSLLP